MVVLLLSLLCPQSHLVLGQEGWRVVLALPPAAVLGGGGALGAQGRAGRGRGGGGRCYRWVEHVRHLLQETRVLRHLKVNKTKTFKIKQNENG